MKPASKTDLASFYHRLAAMLSAGVPIDQALEVIEDSDPTMGELAGAVKQKVLSGHYLSDAMRLHRQVFSDVDIGLVRAGEESGDLQGVVGKLADLTERTEKLRRSLLSTLTYPAIQAFVVLAVAILFVAVLPPDQIFADFGELPAPTRLLVALSRTARDPWLWCFLTLWAVLWWKSLRGAWRMKAFRRHVHQHLLNWPLLGGLIAKVNSARLVFAMTTLLEVGMPMTSTMNLSADMMPNLELRHRLNLARLELSEGSSVAQALKGANFLSPVVISMTEVGEESGRLPSLLRSLLDPLEEEVESSLTNLVRVLEPILMAVAGGVACFVAVAALTPMVRMVANL